LSRNFGLVIAQNKTKEIMPLIKGADISRAIYGKSLTKQSIARIVSEVTRTYRYTSLPELNAVLRQFNVEASRGSEKSIMFQKKGLLYSLMNSDGQRIGIPIKASSLPGKPTLPFLEKQFPLNEAARLPEREQLKNIIERFLQSQAVTSLDSLVKVLAKKQVTAIIRSNAEGRVYGITFVDHYHRTVFNGSALGKQYSATTISGRLAQKGGPTRVTLPGSSPHSIYIGSRVSENSSEAGENLLNQLLIAEGNDARPFQLNLGPNKKRKRKKRNRL
jgi:hypothetical protein